MRGLGREAGLFGLRSGQWLRRPAPVVRSGVTGGRGSCWACSCQRGLTIQTGGHRPQGVGTFLHVHQQLFSWLNALDDFIIDLGWRSRDRGSAPSSLSPRKPRCTHVARASPAGAALPPGRLGRRPPDLRVIVSVIATERIPSGASQNVLRGHPFCLVQLLLELRGCKTESARTSCKVPSGVCPGGHVRGALLFPAEQARGDCFCPRACK